jgi:nucleoside-diphosphate-sugar epimerase
LCSPDTLPAALEGVTAIIDAATARATDSLSIRQVDWDGKQNLIKAAKAAGVDRYVFFSILDAEKFPEVPLMQIKHCTEKLLATSGLNYTILRPCGFLQGLIGQYAIPILEGQAIWVVGQTAPIAYMDTIDIAKFAVAALKAPDTVGQSFPVVGARAWSADEIIKLCERQSGKESKITRMPIGVLRGARQVARFFQWTWNIADRLAFTEVIATGKPLTASMEGVYTAFGLEQSEMTTLEAYMQEYFSRILKKLKEVEFAQEQAKKKERERRARKKKVFPKV